MKLEEILVFVSLILNVETQREQYFASSDSALLDYKDLKISTVLYNVRNKIRCGIICSQISTSSQTNKIMYNVDHPNITQSQCAVFNGNCYFVKKVTSCIKRRSNNSACSCMSPYYGSYCHLVLSSCEDVKHSMESLVNGIYSVATISGEIIEIFCDFQKTQIITFISKQSLSYLTTPDLMQFGSNRTRVVLRQNWINYQKDSILSQLTTHSSIPLSIYINGIGNFKEPANTVFGDFIFLGFLDLSNIYQDSVNGYATDSVDNDFANCKEFGHSYFNFYPNLENKEPTYTTNASNKVDIFAWTQTGVTIAANQELTLDYFYVTEIHFGGCGGLTTSSYWRTINGTALGLITDF
ncbi:hypothetical protein LOTGIDRAFT_159322 [Lottia gigantea]|uniref:Uncharacterized protein n=1 Tax=Lottia gigantea TaxID=225164 RepID=V4AR45_LOTGI|nr:hypothetical protein LOTGIDRAFT_159322 [Lottia gigantea]ESO97300.1 hypothetical protein LOTGIDRAFT_159322 [Lottia gigantea]